MAKWSSSFAFALAFEIEAQVRLALGLVRAVALETGVGKDGPDVAVELDRLRKRLPGARDGESAGKNEREKKAFDPEKVHGGSGQCRSNHRVQPSAIPFRR